MPVSPYRRALEENLVQPSTTDTDSSSESKGKKKRKSKPTSKTRNRKQKVREKYSKAREDAQLAGIIPTTPEGAVRPERVDPASQRMAALPELVRQALKESWNTPDAAKPAIIASLLEPFYQDDVVLDENGKQVRVKPSRAMLMALAKTLLQLDRFQWEKDHPEAAGKARGGGASASVNMQTNVATAAIIRGMIERGELGVFEELRTPAEPDAPGSQALPGQMEAGTTPTGDQQQAGAGVADG